MLTGRTFIAYEDTHLCRSTVNVLTQSQGNTNENEWFALLVNLIRNNSKIHIASFRGMAVNTTELAKKTNQSNMTDQDLQHLVKKTVLKKLKAYELNNMSKQDNS